MGHDVPPNFLIKGYHAGEERERERETAGGSQGIERGYLRDSKKSAWFSPNVKGGSKDKSLKTISLSWKPSPGFPPACLAMCSWSER